MTQLISREVRTARKGHVCFDCRCYIEKNDGHLVTTVKFEGAIETIRQHLDCHDAADYYVRHFDVEDWQDGIPPLVQMLWEGDFQDDLNHLRGFWPHVVCRIEFQDEMFHRADVDNWA